MTLSKRLTALVLCAALTLTPALAVERLPVVNSYTGYSDVKETNWFYSYVRLCTETGLLKGNDDGTFAPNNNLSVAEMATIAARLHSLLRGGTGVIQNPPDAPHWWTGATDYVAALARARNDTVTLHYLDNPQFPISRTGCLLMLSLAVDDSYLTPINQISSLPDTDAPTVLMFYRAGVLNGVDAYGTFAGERLLLRSECAAMLGRIADPSLRLTVTLPDYSVFLAAGMTHDTLLFPNVTAEAYLIKVNDLIRHLEEVCTDSGMEFNWLNAYAGQTFADYVKSTALTELGVEVSTATEAYQSFDVQAYYSRLIDLTGGF